MEICLITNLENTWGLSKDVNILKNILERNGHRIYTAQWNRTPNQGKKFHLNIHVELLGGKHFTMARRNIIIPNQEWFLPDWAHRAKLRFNSTLTKTHLATNLFNSLGFKNVQYTGFTSEDRFRKGFERQRTAYHLAGNSLFKNTEHVIHAWAKHPEWPLLHVFGSNPALQNFVIEAQNIKYTFKHLSNADILAVQNSYWFAIQPSKSEGYGHCITEPLSTGGLVIGIDAAPMNEFPAQLRLPAKQSNTHCYGKLYDPTSFDGLDEIFELSDTELATIGEQNRAWWAKNKQQFETNLIKGIQPR